MAFLGKTSNLPGHVQIKLEHRPCYIHGVIFTATYTTQFRTQSDVIQKLVTEVKCEHGPQSILPTLSLVMILLEMKNERNGMENVSRNENKSLAMLRISLRLFLDN